MDTLCSFSWLLLLFSSFLALGCHFSLSSTALNPPTPASPSHLPHALGLGLDTVG